MYVCPHCVSLCQCVLTVCHSNSMSSLCVTVLLCPHFMSVCPSSKEKRLTAPNISTEKGEVIEEHSTFEQVQIEREEVNKIAIEEEEDNE